MASTRDKEFCGKAAGLHRPSQGQKGATTPELRKAIIKIATEWKIQALYGQMTVPEFNQRYQALVDFMSALGYRTPRTISWTKLYKKLRAADQEFKVPSGLVKRVYRR